MTYQIKDIQDFPGYRVDTNGDVWSCLKMIPIRDKISGRIFGTKKVVGNVYKKLKYVYTGDGYPRVNLFDINRKPHQKSVHGLVLEAFIGLRPRGMEACHNDGNRNNPNVANLRWDTRKNNHADKKMHGTWQGGERGSNVKLNNKQVRVIKWALRVGAKQDNLAKLFNVAQVTISAIKMGKTWSHIII